MAKKTAVLTSEKAVFRVEGLEELIVILRKMGQAAGTVLTRATMAGAEVIAEEAKLHAPGPNIETMLERQEAHRCEVAIGPDREHWHYVFAETGARPHEISPGDVSALKLYPLGDVFASKLAGENQHPGFPARPFLRPAVDSKAEEAIGALAAVLWKEIDKYCEKPE